MNAEFKRQLHAINYSVFEEEGSISGHKDLGDRLLLLDLSDVERCYACNAPGAQLHVPMITKAVIDAARGVAYEHYVAK